MSECEVRYDSRVTRLLNEFFDTEIGGVDGVTDVTINQTETEDVHQVSFTRADKARYSGYLSPGTAEQNVAMQSVALGLLTGRYRGRSLRAWASYREAISAELLIDVKPSIGRLSDHLKHDFHAFCVESIEIDGWGTTVQAGAGTLRHTILGGGAYSMFWWVESDGG